MRLGVIARGTPGGDPSTRFALCPALDAVMKYARLVFDGMIRSHLFWMLP